MITLLFAAITLSSPPAPDKVQVEPVQTEIACTNCNGVGSFEVTCKKCDGKGIVRNPRYRYTKNGIRNSITIPCPDCVKGLSTPDKKGTGKQKVTCKVCHGKKKIKNK